MKVLGKNIVLNLRIGKALQLNTNPTTKKKILTDLAEIKIKKWCLTNYYVLKS